MTRRPRSRRRSPVGEYAVALLLVFAVAFGGGLEAGAFTTGTVDRGSSVDVVADWNAAMAVDPAGSARINATSTLVNVTNHLGQQATVTVSLRGTSTRRGDLVVGGVNHGDTASVSLAAGQRTTIAVAVPNNASFVGKSLDFDVQASASGLDATAPNRSVPITS